MRRLLIIAAAGLVLAAPALAAESGTIRGHTVTARGPFVLDGAVYAKGSVQAPARTAGGTFRVQILRGSRVLHSTRFIIPPSRVAKGWTGSVGAFVCSPASGRRSYTARVLLSLTGAALTVERTRTVLC